MNLRPLTDFARSLAAHSQIVKWLVVVVGFMVLASSPVWALTPTPSPTKTPTVIPGKAATPTLPMVAVTEIPASQSGTVNQNLKKVIDKVVEENQAAIEAKVQSVKTRRKGVVGEVKSIREGIMTLTTPRGTQIIPIDKTVELIKSGKTILLDGIAVGDWVTVLGVIEADNFKPEKIIVSPKSLQTVKPVIMLGTIEKLSASELKFKDRANQDSKTWTVAKTTLWQESNGAKTAVTNFSPNVQVLIIGLESDNGTRVYLVRALAPFSKTQ